MCNTRDMKLWYALISLASAVCIGAWFWITEHLVAIGVDVSATRFVMIAMAAIVLGSVAAEVAVLGVKKKLAEQRTIRTRRSYAEAGQVSVSRGPEAGSVSLSE